jgi:hypothetical protein
LAADDLARDAIGASENDRWIVVDQVIQSAIRRWESVCRRLAYRTLPTRHQVMLTTVPTATGRTVPPNSADLPYLTSVPAKPRPLARLHCARRRLDSPPKAAVCARFLKCRAPYAVAHSLAATGDLCGVVRRRQRRLRRGAPRRRRRSCLAVALPTAAIRNRAAKFLGHRSDRASTRCDQINRLPFVVVRKRPTLTSFHPTPAGPSSLLQLSISSDEVQGCSGSTGKAARISPH